jgi:hypothetical protein
MCTVYAWKANMHRICSHIIRCCLNWNNLLHHIWELQSLVKNISTSWFILMLLGHTDLQVVTFFSTQLKLSFRYRFTKCMFHDKFVLLWFSSLFMMGTSSEKSQFPWVIRNWIQIIPLSGIITKYKSSSNKSLLPSKYFIFIFVYKLHLPVQEITPTNQNNILIS